MVLYPFSLSSLVLGTPGQHRLHGHFANLRPPKAVGLMELFFRFALLLRTFKIVVVMQPHSSQVGPQDSEGYVASCGFVLGLGTPKNVGLMLLVAHV